jgi:hypothetical protein
VQLRELKERLRLLFRPYWDRWDRWRFIVSEHWLTSNIVALTVAIVLVTGCMVLLMYAFAVPLSSRTVGTLLTIDIVGIALVGNVTIDMMRRYEAKNRLARLLSSLDDERWLYLRRGLEMRYPLFMFQPQDHVPDPDREWFRVWEFLHGDPYGTLASQALFQRSPIGRMRYFNEVLEMARRHRRRSQLQ